MGAPRAHVTPGLLTATCRANREQTAVPLTLVLGWGHLPNHAPKPRTGKKTGGKRRPKTQAHTPRAGLRPAPEGSLLTGAPGEQGAEAGVPSAGRLCLDLFLRVFPRHPAW